MTSTSIRAGCRHLCNAYTRTNVIAVGGRAYLIYPVPRPGWLGESIEGLLTKVELGSERRPAGVGELYGVNLSFRKDCSQPDRRLPHGHRANRDHTLWR